MANQCLPICAPQPQFPGCSRLPSEVSICCASARFEVACIDSFSGQTSQDVAFANEVLYCDADNRLGSNLSGSILDDSPEAVSRGHQIYQCVFGALVPYGHQPSLMVEWTYDCASNAVIFRAFVRLIQYDIWGNSTGGNRYLIAKLVTDPDWVESLPLVLPATTEVDAEHGAFTVIRDSASDVTVTFDLTCEPISNEPCVTIPLFVDVLTTYVEVGPTLGPPREVVVDGIYGMTPSGSSWTEVPPGGGYVVRARMAPNDNTAMHACTPPLRSYALRIEHLSVELFASGPPSYHCVECGGVTFGPITTSNILGPHPDDPGYHVSVTITVYG